MTILNILDPFILRMLVAGIGIALVTGIMGCFVVWRRMAYFGDSLSHSALLGIVIGLMTGLPMNIGIIIVCSLFAVLLLWLQSRKILSSDTLLGILAHASLSIGIVAFSFTEQNIDLHSLLFGDILTVSWQEIIWIYGGGLVILCTIWRFWTSLLLSTISEELAIAEGINSFIMNMIFMFLMTIIVAVSMRVIGALLITSLLIIPAATARQFSRSPTQMAAQSALFGVIAVILGGLISIYYDTPSGPTIISASALMFIGLLPFRKY